MEIILYRRAFAPGAIDEDVTVRCANCGLVDERRRGHDQTDCVNALRAEVDRLRAELDLAGAVSDCTPLDLLA